MALVFVGLGCNLNDRHASLVEAVASLRRDDRVASLACSSVYETDPVGISDQPAFLNAVACLHWSACALELLDLLLEIERANGRFREREVRWGPRTLDLDVLLFGDAVIDDERLTVPHPRLCERWFVLAPLAELEANVGVPIVVPGAGAAAGELLDRLVGDPDLAQPGGRIVQPASALG